MNYRPITPPPPRPTSANATPAGKAKTPAKDGPPVTESLLIGSGSIVLHEAVIRSGALVGAGAVVSGGTDVPGGAMALGVPAKIRPDSVPAGSFTENVRLYVENGHRYSAELRRLD